MVRKDRLKIEEDTHRKMLGMITLFMWLGKGIKQKDHSRSLSNIWQKVKEAKRDSFWGPSTVQSAMAGDILTPFPTYSGRKGLNQLTKLESGTLVEEFGQKTYFKLFLQKIIHNKDLILYAQREFISSFFKDELYQLDDTNVPFDWDHISPRKHIQGEKRIPDPIKH